MLDIGDWVCIVLFTGTVFSVYLEPAIHIVSLLDHVAVHDVHGYVMGMLVLLFVEYVHHLSRYGTGRFSFIDTES